MKRILIVDDAATVRMYHRGILETAGYAVDEAINGIEALEKVLQSQAEPFDLYLVDINMPKMDGYAFLAELRRQEIAQAPAIMISTEADGGDKRRAYAAGANFYLLKPVKPDALLLHTRLLLGGTSP